MKWLKIVSAVILVTVAALLLVAAPTMYGQDRTERAARELAFPFIGGVEIGASIRDVDPSSADGGVIIEDVRPGSPADQAGLRRADLVVEFDGERVRSARQFSRLVQEAASNRTVKVGIVREGQRRDVDLQPAERRANLLLEGDRLRDFSALAKGFSPFEFEFDGAVPGLASRRQLGVTVQELSKQLADYFGAKEGVLVSSVVDGSPAASAGLKAGDVIVSINGDRVPNVPDLMRSLGRIAAPADVIVGIVRDRKETTITARIDPLPRVRKTL